MSLGEYGLREYNGHLVVVSGKSGNKKLLTYEELKNHISDWLFENRRSLFTTKNTDPFYAEVHRVVEEMLDLLVKTYELQGTSYVSDLTIHASTVKYLRDKRN